MFTPQRKAPWTPSTALPRTEPRPNSKNPLFASAYETKAGLGSGSGFLDTPPTPPPTSSLGVLDGVGFGGGSGGANSEDWKRFKEAGLLDESALEIKDRQATLHKISRLENELFDYQYNMGLLLMEKNSLVSKTEELGQEVSEATEILKRERAAHLIAISEAEKREENLKKALNVQRKSLADLERALHDMHEEYAKTKATSDTTMSDLNTRMEELQKKSSDVKERSRLVDVKVHEFDRKNYELDRKLQDLEDRESILQREKLLLSQERESHDLYFRKQKEDLLEWERKLEEGEQRLCESRRILNEREEKLHEAENSGKAKESKIEDLQKKIDLANATLKNLENDVKNKTLDLDMKEKSAEAIRHKLEARERQLQEEEERLDAKEKVELEKLLNEHKVMLNAKMQEFELDMKQKRTALEEELESRKEAVDHKETEISHLEVKLGKREQALEKKSKRVNEKEKDIDMKNKALKEQEKCLKAEGKRLEVEKKQVNVEIENLEIIRKEIELLKDNVMKQELHIEEERKNLEHAEKERLEYLRLQSILKQEMSSVRRQGELIEKEAAELKLEREKFEKDWEALDEKRTAVDNELKALAEKKASFEKLRNTEEERLERERIENEERLRLEVESFRLQKESFEATMEHEKLMLAEKANKEHALMLQDFEQQKQDLHIDMQKRREQWGKLVEEKEKALEETRLKNMTNLKNLKEDAERKKNEMEIERRRLENEREELELNKKQLEETGIDIAKDIEALDKLSKKLKEQRVQLVSEREHFGGVVEKIKCCKNCGDLAQAFHHGDFQLPTVERSSHFLRLPRDDQSDAKDDFAPLDDSNTAKSSHPSGDGRELPQYGGQMSVLRKCASIIFKLSPKKEIQHTDKFAMQQSPHSATHSRANEHVREQTSAVEEVNMRAVSDNPRLALERVKDAIKPSKSDFREDNINNSRTVDEFDIDSEVQSIKEPEKSDMKNVQRKSGRRRGPGVRRTHSVKAVVEDAAAILGDGSGDKMEEQPKDSTGPNVNNQEMNLPADMTHATTSARKRSRSQASKVTESEQDVDHSDENADSVTTVSRRKRRQTVASAQPTPGQRRYNLRRHAVAASSGKPENEDEATHENANEAVQNPEETPSQSLDVAVDSKQRLHFAQVSTTRSVEISSDRCHETTDSAGDHVDAAKPVDFAISTEINAAEDTLLSEEFNETLEKVEEDSRSMVHENGDDDDDDDDDDDGDDDDDDDDDGDGDEDEDEDEDYHPGQVSLGKKVWKFLTS